MSQKNIIVAVLLVLVVVAGAWFMWQRRSGSEAAALNQEIEAEIKASDAGMAELEARLSR